MTDEEQQKYEDLMFWKKNATFLYDYAGSTRLKTMSMTLDYSNITFKDPNEPSIERQLALLGTRYKDERSSKNRLKLISVPVPIKNTNKDTVDFMSIIEATKYIPRPQQNSNYEGFGFLDHQNYMNYAANNEMIYEHSRGEVNRARFHPDDPTICATSGPGGDLSIYKLYENIDEIVERSIKTKVPLTSINGHSDQNWAISWSPYKSSRILSCGHDSRCFVYDLEIGKKQVVKSLHREFEEFTEPPMDGIWRTRDTFMTADEGGRVRLFDLRDQHQLVWDVNVSPHGLNTIDIHPGLEYIVVVAGDDHRIRVMDIRKHDPDIHNIDVHKSSVQEISFNPHNTNLILSGDSEGKCIINDLGNIGKEQSREDEIDGPPELEMLHSGHLDCVVDVRWNPLGPSRGFNKLAGSVSDDCTFQQWSPIDECDKSDTFQSTMNKVIDYKKSLKLWKLIS